MVTVDTFGIWEKDDGSFVKEGPEVRVVLDDMGDGHVYCFIEYETRVLEFEGVFESADAACRSVMKRESHGEDIVDVLDDLGFTQY